MLSDHYYGKLSLERSFWLGGLAQAITVRGIAYLVFILSNSMSSFLGDPYLTIIYTALTFGLTIPIFLFWIVGAFRSAFRTGTSSGAWLWPGSAIVVLTSLCLFEVGTVYMESVPDISDAYLAAAGDPEWPSGSVSLRDHNTVVRVHGHITSALSGLVRKTLEIYPGVSTVILSSPGGRLGAAEEMKKEFQLRQVTTLVEDECDSACTVAFLGGRIRLMTSAAKLGFHAFTQDGEITDDQDQSLRDEGLRAGVSKEFLEQAYSAKLSSVWYPTPRQLAASRFVTDVISHPASVR